MKNGVAQAVRSYSVWYFSPPAMAWRMSSRSSSYRRLSAARASSSAVGSPAQRSRSRVRFGRRAEEGYAQPVLRRADRLHDPDVRAFRLVAPAVDQQSLLQPAESNHDDIGVAQRA